MNNNYVTLSWVINNETIGYGGFQGVKISPLKQISKGDTANTHRIELHNHSGTHIDFPYHFIEAGKKSHEYDAGFWVFASPWMVNIQVNDGEVFILTSEVIASIPRETDFLILKTGFGGFRNEDKFWSNNPGLSPELAAKLKFQCPKLKIIGLDTISLTSYKHREIGRVSHREFLGTNDILVVEDMKLDELVEQPKKLICLPLLIEGIDGAPVHIIAKL